MLRIDTFHTEAGTRTVPSAFPTAPLLRVYDGATVTVGTGSLVDAGMYVFPQLPIGDRYLYFGGMFFVNPAPVVDMSSHYVGRAGVAVTDGGTFLNLTMTGGAPFPDFTLQLTDMSADIMASEYEYGLVSPLPNVGEPPTFFRELITRRHWG